jgi:hypothetical protein
MRGLAEGLNAEGGKQQTKIGRKNAKLFVSPAGDAGAPIGAGKISFAF